MELRMIENIQAGATPFWDFIFKGITLIGGEYFLVLTFLIFYYALDKKFAINFIIAVAATSFLNYVLKIIVKRPRPYVASENVIPKTKSNGYSFASGHSVCVSAMASSYVYGSRNKAKKLWITYVICFLVCLLVGFSRLYLGHHYLTDVLVGLLIGSCLTPFVLFLLDKLSRFNYQKFLCLIFGILGAAGCLFCVTEWFKVVNINNLNFLRACGGVFGIGFGMFFEFKYVNFDVKTVKDKKLVLGISCLGIFQVLAIYLIISLLPSIGIIVFLSLAFVGFFATFIETLIMKKIYTKMKAI